MKYRILTLLLTLGLFSLVSCVGDDQAQDDGSGRAGSDDNGKESPCFIHEINK